MKKIVLFFILFFFKSFAQDDVVDRFVIVVDDVLKYKIDPSLYNDKDSFIVDFDSNIVENITDEKDFKENRVYHFLGLKVGKTTVVIDKVNLSGGYKNFIKLEIIVIEEKVGDEDFDDFDQLLEDDGTIIRKDGDKPDNKKIKKNKNQKSFKKRTQDIVYEELIDNFNSGYYKIRRDAYITSIDEFIDKYKTDERLVELKYIKSNVYLSMGDKEKSDEILEEILKDKNFRKIDFEDKNFLLLKKKVLYDLYKNSRDKKNLNKAREYLNDMINITDIKDVIYPYLIYKLGKINKEDHREGLSLEQMKYLYSLIGVKNKDGSIKKFKDLTQEEKDGIRNIFKEDTTLIDKIIFDLANLYESPGKFRDMNRSKELYEELIRKFPKSDLAIYAKMRKFYINNNFIKPR